MRFTPARYVASDFVRAVGGVACAALLLVAGPGWMASAAAQGTGTSTSDYCATIQDNPGLVSDCEALLVVRDALGGSLSQHWSISTEISRWTGVTVGGTPGRVTKVEPSPERYWRFDPLTLDGYLPPELGDLPYLTHLNLEGHTLSGEIPPELGNLANLEVLNLAGDWAHLDYDFLSGEIPSELGNLTNLRVLDLSHNNLSGDIPSELVDLPNLEKVYLGHNHFTCIPEGIRGVLKDASQVFFVPYCNGDPGATPRVIRIDLNASRHSPETGESTSFRADVFFTGFPLSYSCELQTKLPGDTTWLEVEGASAVCTWGSSVTKHQAGVYLFRVKTSDQYGKVVYSDPVTITWRAPEPPPNVPSTIVAEQTIELGPGSSNQTVELAWDDGETVAVELRVHDAKPSYVPGSVEVGGDVTYQIDPWESNPRSIIFSRPEHGYIHVTWSYAVPPVENDPVAERTVELGPGSSNQTVELAWDDGETVAIELRVYDAKPSYVPSSIEVGGDVTYQINAWGSNPREAIFTRPGHGHIQVTWSYAQ